MTTAEEKTSLLKKAESVALVLPKTLHDDVIGSALASAVVFEKLNKRVVVFSETEIPNHWKCLDLLPLKETATPSRYSMAINSKKNPIKEISYENDPETNELKIFITPIQSSLKKDDFLFSEEKSTYGAVLVFGTGNVASIGKIWSERPDLFYEKNLFILKATSSHVSSMADETATVLKKLVSDFDEHTSTALLFSLFSETNCLQKKNLAQETLTLASELLAYGANHEAVTACLLESDEESIPLLQLWGRACVRSKLEKETRVFWSFLTADDFIKTGTTPKAVSYILRQMEKVFVLPLISVFLWQDPETKKVRPEIIAKDKQFVQTSLSKEFDSFIAAENEIRQLLHTLA